MKSELQQEGRRQRRAIVGGMGPLAATVALAETNVRLDTVI